MPNSSKASTNKLAKLNRLLFIVFLSLFLILACQFFISSILIVKPEQTITQWENKKQPVNSAQAYTIVSRLERAERLAFLPLQLKDTNKINELYSRLYIALSLIENQKSNLELAELHAIKLTQAAPSNYLGWTLLAQSKIYKDNYTWEDQSALTRALILAPYEKSNQIRLIPLLIEHWENISRRNKALANNMISNALNDIQTTDLAILNMREFNKVKHFTTLIVKSRLNKRIERMIQK